MNKQGSREVVVTKRHHMGMYRKVDYYFLDVSIFAKPDRRGDDAGLWKVGRGPQSKLGGAAGGVEPAARLSCTVVCFLGTVAPRRVTGMLAPGLKSSSFESSHLGGVCGVEIGVKTMPPSFRVNGVSGVDPMVSLDDVGFCGVLNATGGGVALFTLVLSKGSFRTVNNAFLSLCAARSAFKAAAVTAATLGVTLKGFLRMGSGKRASLTGVIGAVGLSSKSSLPIRVESC